MYYLGAASILGDKREENNRQKQLLNPTIEMTNKLLIRWHVSDGVSQNQEHSYEKIRTERKSRHAHFKWLQKWRRHLFCLICKNVKNKNRFYWNFTMPITNWLLDWTAVTATAVWLVQQQLAPPALAENGNGGGATAHVILRREI